MKLRMTILSLSCIMAMAAYPVSLVIVQADDDKRPIAYLLGILIAWFATNAAVASLKLIDDYLFTLAVSSMISAAGLLGTFCTLGTFVLILAASPNSHASRDSDFWGGDWVLLFCCLVSVMLSASISMLVFEILQDRAREKYRTNQS